MQKDEMSGFYFLQFNFVKALKVFQRLKKLAHVQLYFYKTDICHKIPQIFVPQKFPHAHKSSQCNLVRICVLQFANARKL